MEEGWKERGPLLLFNPLWGMEYPLCFLYGSLPTGAINKSTFNPLHHELLQARNFYIHYCYNEFLGRKTTVIN
jgi:hypothetical protein